MASKVSEVFERLVKGVESVVTSEKWREFLKFQAAFYNYSFNNSLLIWLQCPEATRVAGFQTWKKLGRYVKKAEKGIKILAPMSYKKAVEDEEGNEMEKQFLQGFRVVHVFDVSQTNGKELPEICSLLQGADGAAEKLLAALRQVIAIPVTEEEITGGANGYYHLQDDRIALKAGLSVNQKAKTLLHEYVHSLLDRKDSEVKNSRHEAEIIAESVAFMVANYFGLDTSSYSFEYVASWAGSEPKELLKKGEMVQSTAAKVINQVEQQLQEKLVG